MAIISKIATMAKSTCWAVCCGYCFLNFIAEPILCQGPSMEPTIYDNDIILSEHISIIFQRKVQRGDIIFARSPQDPNTIICKRVLAVSGDTIKKGLLTNLVIPKGHVWIQGDNEHNSSDSRDYGPVPMGLVLGKAIYKLWPLMRLKSL